MLIEFEFEEGGRSHAKGRGPSCPLLPRFPSNFGKRALRVSFKNNVQSQSKQAKKLFVLRQLLNDFCYLLEGMPNFSSGSWGSFLLRTLLIAFWDGTTLSLNVLFTGRSLIDWMS